MVDCFINTFCFPKIEKCKICIEKYNYETYFKAYFYHENKSYFK